MELTYLVNVHVVYLYLAIDKLVTDETQNLFSLISENSDFIRYSLNKLDWIISIIVLFVS